MLSTRCSGQAAVLARCLCLLAPHGVATSNVHHWLTRRCLIWQGRRERRHPRVWAHAAHQGGGALLDLSGQPDVRWTELHTSKRTASKRVACLHTTPGLGFASPPLLHRSHRSKADLGGCLHVFCSSAQPLAFRPCQEQCFKMRPCPMPRTACRVPPTRIGIPRTPTCTHTACTTPRVGCGSCCRKRQLHTCTDRRLHPARGRLPASGAAALLC